MKTDQTVTDKSNKRLFGILFSASILLLIPILLQLTIGTGIDGQGFNWKLGDFAIFAFLIFSTAFLSELVLRKVKSPQKRILICAAIILMFLIIWVDLAVGIFNIPGFSGN